MTEMKNPVNENMSFIKKKIYLRLFNASLMSAFEEGGRVEAEKETLCLTRRRERCCRDPFFESPTLNIPSEAALVAILLGTARLTLHL